MANSAFSPTVLTIPGSTSGSGQGELNLVTNPVAATDTTGWTGAGRGTAGGPLNPSVSTYFTVLNAVSGESSTSGAYDVITLPSGLQNRKLKVEFYYTSPAADTFKVSVYKGTTRVPLSTDSSGTTTLPQSTTGKFTAYFDTDSSGTWTLSITRTAGTGSTALQFTQVVVGPGIQPQGAVVDEWTRYTPSIVWPTTNQGTLDAAGTQLQYRRVGSAIEIRGVIAMSALGTSLSALEFTLPPGLTPDQSVISAARNRRNDDVGSGSLYRATAVTTVQTFPRIDSTATSSSGQNVFGFTTSSGGTPETYSSLVPANWSSGSDRLYMQFRIPIAEWAGSGTVQLAQNDVEYAWNSDVSATASVTGSGFGYGPSGVEFPDSNWAIGTNYIRRVQFQTPVQVGDSVIVEIDYNNDGRWEPITNIIPQAAQSTVSYGCGIYPVPNSGLQYDVYFRSGGAFANGASYGANGTTSWSNFGANANARWRVRKSSAGAAVGFGIVQPGVSSGLVSSLGLPGKTDGLAVTSGYVGEQVGTLRSGTGGFTYSIQSTTAVPATTPTSVISRVLNKGVYLISFKTQCYSNLSTASLLATFRIGGTAVTQNLVAAALPTTTGYISATIPTVISADSTTVAVYANVDAGATSGGSLHEMWIVRIA